MINTTTRLEFERLHPYLFKQKKEPCFARLFLAENEGLSNRFTSWKFDELHFVPVRTQGFSSHFLKQKKSLAMQDSFLAENEGLTNRFTSWKFDELHFVPVRTREFSSHFLKQKKEPCDARLFSGGEWGIRTPGTSRYNSFQDYRNRPLCQFSEAKVVILSKLTNIF